MLSEPSSRRRNIARPLGLCLIVFAIGYCVQVFSPLRLNNDSVRFLALATSFLDGNGFTTAGASSYLSLGYPRLLAALAQTGLDWPRFLIALNLLFLIAGLAALDRIAVWEFAFTPVKRIALHIGALANVLTINYVALPQTETVFFGTAMLAIMLASAPVRTQMQRLGLRVAAAILATAAIDVRTIGVALLPGIGLSLAWSLAGRDLAISLRDVRVWRIALGLAIASIAMAAVARLSGYWYYLDLWTWDGAWIFNHVWRQAAVFAQALLNLPNRLAGTNSNPILAIAAIPLLAVFARSIRRRAHRFTPVDLTILFYGCVVFIWPDYQSRFWMPMLPLLLVYGIDAIGGPRDGLARWGLGAFIALYVSLGAAGLAYSTWLTFSGRAFVERYGSDEIREMYGAAYSGTSVEFSELNKRIVYEMLKRHEPLARTVPPQPPK